MKKIIVMLMLIWSSAFGEVRDGINLFSSNATDKTRLELGIKELEKKYKVKIYVVTLENEEEKITEGLERTIILSIEKGKDRLKVKESFSRDLNMEDKEEELNKVIDEADKYIQQGNFYLYISEILNKSLELYHEEEVIEESINVSDKWRIISWIIIVLTIINILARISRVKKKKYSRYQS